MTPRLSAKQWAQMYDRLSCDPALSPTRHRVLTTILRHVGSKDRDVTHQTVANEIGMDRRTVIRAVKWLRENGYLDVTRRADEHGYQAANGYWPGLVTLAESPAPECHQSDTRVTPVSQQKSETTNPTPGLSVGETQVEKDLSGEIHFARARESVGSQVPETCPGESSPEGAESVESPQPPQEQPYVHPARRSPSMSAVERVLDRLDRVRRNGTSTLASCPVGSHGKGNGDRDPSLSVTESDGKVLLNCMSGCHVQDVLVAMNLDWSDLWDEPITNSRGEKVAEWVYTLPDGTDHLVVERWNTPGGGKRFVQRRPGHTASDGLGQGFWNVLYRLPRIIAAAKAGEPIWIVEGEKCVAAAERLGLTATTGPGGARNWKDYYGKWLVGAPVVNIVADNDDVGRAFASMVAASLKGRGLTVKTWAVAVPGDKADLYDHVLAGRGVADLVPTRLNQFRPEGRIAGGLLASEFPPVEWVIQDLMPIGFTVLGGAPKVGKSFVALDAAMNVALGGDFLHTQRCEKGSVLYLSLDNDAEWRLQLRLKHLQMQYGVSLADVDIEFHCDFPTGEAGIQGIAEWCAEKREEGRRPLLAVADTIAKAEPNFDGSNARGEATNGGYAGSTQNLSKWSRLALEQRIGVLGVHHIRKSGDDDWMNRFIGSQGIVATATTLMMLDPEKRGAEKGSLHVSSRDAGDHELEIRREGWSWHLVEPARRERIVTTRPGLYGIPGGRT